MIYNAENFPELPRCWASLTVDNSVESAGNSNKKLKSKDALEHGRFPVIDQGQSEISGYSDDENLVVDASESSPVILFGDHTRLLKQISQPFVPGADGTKLFRAKSFWDTRFVYQMLRAIKLPDKGYARHFQYLRDSVLPLPPLPEQKRIADKLDAVLARVDACRDRLDRIPSILKRFRQSVLAAATSGKLTEDWRSARQLPAPTSVLLGDCCDVLGGKRLPKGFELTEQDTGFPYVRVTDFAAFSVKVKQLKFVPPEAAALISRYIINGDDIYISIAGSIGLVGQVPQNISGSNLTENAARIVARHNFIPRFLMYQLASPALQDQMQEKKIATTQDKLGLFRIKELELLRPSIEEQTEIVRRVEALFTYADRLEARYTAARAQVEKLTPATLAKAFRGELVPQDPNDEPASALLERIRAQRGDQVVNKSKRMIREVAQTKHLEETS